MQLIKIIKEYLQSILVFFIALFAYRYYKSENDKLKKQVKQEQQKTSNYQSQIDTYNTHQEAERNDIEKAKNHSRIKRDYFE